MANPMIYWTSDIFKPRIHLGKPSDGLVDFKIFMEVSVFPFHSVLTLTGTFKIARSTIWDHFRNRPFAVNHVRWVPGMLDDLIKRNRTMTAESLLKNLRHARHQG
jgi:hypothetical protein